MPRLRSLTRQLQTVDLRRARPAEKTADPFYSTPDYRLWRTAVISRAHGRCEWVGCTEPSGRRYADHIVEIKDGGEPFDIANGQCLCHRHHAQKTAAERAKRMTQKY